MINLLVVMFRRKRKTILNMASKGRYDFSDLEEVKRFIDDFYKVTERYVQKPA